VAVAGAEVVSMDGHECGLTTVNCLEASALSLHQRTFSGQLQFYAVTGKPCFAFICNKRWPDQHFAEVGLQEIFDLISQAFPCLCHTPA